MQRAQVENLSLAELIRNICYTWAYNEQPSTDQGYAQARTVAAKLAHDAVDRALELLPERYEDVQTFINEANARQVAKRIRKHGNG